MCSATVDIVSAAEAKPLEKKNDKQPAKPGNLTRN